MFHKHLEKSKVNYVQHFCWAMIAGLRLIYAGLASIIHGFFPSLFDGTPAKVVIDIYHDHLKNHPNDDYQKLINQKSNKKID